MYAKCAKKEDLEKELTKLRKFLEHIILKKGSINVKYDLNKDGRIFGAPYTIQCISGVVRNFLLEDTDVVDVDIVNSISCVMLSICKKHDIKCKTLTKYYNERQTIIDKYYDGDKDACKNFINASFFKNYTRIKPNNVFEKGIAKDIKAIHDYVFNHDDFVKYRENATKTCKRDNIDNVKGRTLNYVYTDIECDILKAAMHYYLTVTKKCVRTAMFDGFIADKSDMFKLSKLNKAMRNHINSDITFIYKPITQNIIPKMTAEDYFNTDECLCRIYSEIRKTRLLKKKNCQS